MTIVLLIVAILFIVSRVLKASIGSHQYMSSQQIEQLKESGHIKPKFQEEDEAAQKRFEEWWN